MSALAISAIVFVCVFGGALLGLALRSVLPTHHLAKDSMRIVKLSMGLVATLTALVLGLLIGSVKGSFDAKNDGVKRIAANLILLDRTMAQLGTAAAPARQLLRETASSRHNVLLEAKVVTGTARDGAVGSQGSEGVQRMLLELPVKTRPEEILQTRALEVSGEIAQAHWLLTENFESSIPTPFLVVLVFWLVILFVSFGLFAPSNGTVVTAFFVCALSVSGALFLILEMDGAFDGFIKVSLEPLTDALSHLGK